jgi:hypothetical protein
MAQIKQLNAVEDIILNIYKIIFEDAYYLIAIIFISKNIY